MLKRQKTIENIEIIYHYGLGKMRDSGNFILNRADWKMIKKKIPFDATGKKCAWEQCLIKRCCYSFGSPGADDTRESLVTKIMCLVCYAAKLASN